MSLTRTCFVSGLNPDWLLPGNRFIFRATAVVVALELQFIATIERLVSWRRHTLIILWPIPSNSLSALQWTPLILLLLLLPPPLQLTKTPFLCANFPLPPQTKSCITFQPLGLLDLALWWQKKKINRLPMKKPQRKKIKTSDLTLCTLSRRKMQRKQCKRCQKQNSKARNSRLNSRSRSP